MIYSSLRLPCAITIFLLLSIVNLVSAFPGRAGHCGSGDLSSRSYSGHGATGRGSLANGSIQVKFDSITLNTSSTTSLSPNKEYTVTLESSASDFRGFLVRLSGANGVSANGVLFTESDWNVESLSFCANGISGMTHKGPSNKSSVSFSFDYTGNAGVSLLLEVTVVQSRTSNAWYYSAFDLSIANPTFPPIAATSAPSAATSAPSEATSSPSEASLAPSAATSAPSEATSTPSLSTLAPSVATLAPSTSSSAPSVVISAPPSEATPSPSFSTSAPSSSTSAPADSTLTPAASLAPVSSTQSPTTSSSSFTCEDTTLRFKVEWNERMVTRDCIWIGNRATIQRCKIEGVSAACPVTCGTCSTCEDTTLRFKVEWNGKKIMRDCIWIGNRATIQRCNIEGVAEACPVTCGICS